MSRKMSTKNVCDLCLTEFTTKYNLQRHRGTDRCAKMLDKNTKVRSELLKPAGAAIIPDTVEYSCNSGIRAINTYSARGRENPQLTCFRYTTGQNKFTSSMKLPIWEQTTELKPSARFVISAVKCDMVSMATISINASTVPEGDIIVRFMDSELFAMSIRRAYELSVLTDVCQANLPDRIHIPVQTLITGNRFQFLPTVCGDLVITVEFDDPTTVRSVELSADGFALSKDELNHVKYTAKEIVLNGYTLVNGTINSLLPICDIYLFSSDSQKCHAQPVIYCDHQCIPLIPSRSGMLKVRPHEHLMWVYLSDLPSEVGGFTPDQWACQLPSSDCIILGGERFMCRHPNLLQISNGGSYLHTGLTQDSRPQKELELERVVTTYRNRGPIGVKELMTTMNSAMLQQRFDWVKGEHYEGKWFKPNPEVWRFPLPIPTNEPVDQQIVDDIVELIKHCTKAQVLGSLNTIKFTDKPLAEYLPKDIPNNTIFTFKSRGSTFKFDSTLFYYMQLGVQLSEKFMEEVAWQVANDFLCSSYVVPNGGAEAPTAKQPTQIEEGAGADDGEGEGECEWCSMGAPAPPQRNN